MASTRICTKRRSLAQRSISSTAYSVFCNGTTMEARSRGSRSSHSLATQYAREGKGHVLAEEEAHPIEAIQDRNPRLPAVADMRRQLGGGGGGAPVFAAPLRPRRQRRVGRIGDG